MLVTGATGGILPWLCTNKLYHSQSILAIFLILFFHLINALPPFLLLSILPNIIFFLMQIPLASLAQNLFTEHHFKEEQSAFLWFRTNYIQIYILKESYPFFILFFSKVPGFTEGINIRKIFALRYSLIIIMPLSFMILSTFVIAILLQN